MKTHKARGQNVYAKEDGFTLAEVLITIALMGILLGIAVSTWNGVTDSRRAESAANQLAADLRLAHTNATNQLTHWHVIEDKSDIPDAPDVSSADYYLVLDEGGVSVDDVEPRNLPERTRLSSFEDVTFEADGSASKLGGGDCGELSYEVEADSGEPSPGMRLTCSTSGVERVA